MNFEESYIIAHKQDNEGFKVTIPLQIIRENGLCAVIWADGVELSVDFPSLPETSEKGYLRAHQLFQMASTLEYIAAESARLTADKS